MSHGSMMESGDDRLRVIGTRVIATKLLSIVGIIFGIYLGAMLFGRAESLFWPVLIGGAIGLGLNFVIGSSDRDASIDGGRLTGPGYLSRVDGRVEEVYPRGLISKLLLLPQKIKTDRGTVYLSPWQYDAESYRQFVDQLEASARENGAGRASDPV